ncbi:MAG TPA: hypothetical protein VGP31_17515 [Planosporangium sp.]|nr:hypothetical protein [Planosporangium sp.]
MARDECHNQRCFVDPLNRLGSPRVTVGVTASRTTWLPVLAGNRAPGVQGIDANLVGTVKRADGGVQVTPAGRPLYRYLGDQPAAASRRRRPHASVTAAIDRSER